MTRDPENSAEAPAAAPRKATPGPLRPWTILLLAPLLLLFPTCEDASESPRRPSVLLISIDTLRADHLGCYGYERETSPGLDALAEEGVLFERALSPTSWTLPSHVTLFTGLPISAHGICDDRLWTRVGADGAPLPAPLRGTWLAEPVKDAGYRTAGFYSWKYLEPQFGFGSGFEEWERLGHSLFSHPETGPRFEELRRAGDVEGMKALAAAYPDLPLDEGTPCADDIVDRASDWLDGVGAEEDFFLFVHLFDVHDPYTPPAPYDAMFDPDYSGPIDGRRVTSTDSPVRGDMAPRDLENLVARYDGGIAWVDSQVSRLLERLEQQGRADNTLVIVTSDHGEEFFEHGHKTHRRQLHPESIHVPLIARWPAAWPGGQRVGGTSGLVDVAPTIYRALGIEPPAPLGGIPLQEAMAAGSAPGDRTLLAELFVFDGPGAPLRLANLTRGDEQLLLEARGSGSWSAERYDLAGDPHGLGAGEALTGEELEQLRSRLERLTTYLQRLREGQEDRSAALPTLSEHDRQQLAALGYAGLEDVEQIVGGDAAGGLCLEGCFWH